MELSFEDKPLLYTGDYLEDSVFKVDPIRNRKADLAIIDGCYLKEECYQDNLIRLRLLLEELEGKTILPLPKNGRSMDVIDLLNQNGLDYQIHGKSFFIENTKTYLKHDIPIHPKKNGDIILIQDPQLKDPISRKTVDSYPNANLIFTGTIDRGSYSDYLLHHRKNTFFSRVNVHQTLKEAEDLAKKNAFSNVIYFHNPNLLEKTELEF